MPASQPDIQDTLRARHLVEGRNMREPRRDQSRHCAPKVVSGDLLEQGVKAPVPERATVAAVVVTFHPQPDLAAKLGSLLSQVGAIVVVYNGSCAAHLPARDDPTLAGRVEVIANGENRRIGEALNQGLHRAKELGFGWALTLDQDSSPLLEAPSLALPRCRPCRPSKALLVFRTYWRNRPRSFPLRPTGTRRVWIGATTWLWIWTSGTSWRRSALSSTFQTRYWRASACTPRPSRGLGRPLLPARTWQFADATVCHCGAGK